MNAPAAFDIMESVLLKGNLAKLTSDEKLKYYNEVCRSIGLNPLTQPFAYVTLSGREVLYATRNCADQLRKINNVSLEIISRTVANNILTVHCRARLPDGRTDEDFGSVYYPETLQGEARANAELKCVPLDTEILTMEGWKTHGHLRTGEAVLGYNINTDHTEWTLLEAVHRFDKMEMGTLKTENGRFSVRCSPGHRWVMERQPYTIRSTGARGIRGAYSNRKSPRHLVNVEDIDKNGNGQRLVIAAPEIDQIDSLLTPTEAAILGWAVTDGTIQRRGSFVRIGICQSKEDNFAEIETAVSGISDSWTKSVTPATIRTFPSSGQTYQCLPQHWWYLPAEVSRSLLARCGFSSRNDLPRIITRLNPTARAAMLQAFIAAEGSVRSNSTCFINTDPVLMDCFQILCALEGISSGNLATRTIYEGYRPWMSQGMKKRRHIRVGNLRWQVDAIEPAWCPTTGLDTWVMRQNGTVTITGNCVTKAKRRTTLSICGLGWLDENEIDDIPVVAHRRPPAPAPNAMISAPDERAARNDVLQTVGATASARPLHDPETGEVLPPAPNNAAAEQAAPPDMVAPDGAALSLSDLAREAALRGEAAFKAFYKTRSAQERKLLNDMGEELRGLMQ